MSLSPWGTSVEGRRRRKGTERSAWMPRFSVSCCVRPPTVPFLHTRRGGGCWEREAPMALGCDVAGRRGRGDCSARAKGRRCGRGQGDRPSDPYGGWPSPGGSRASIPAAWRRPPRAVAYAHHLRRCRRAPQCGRGHRIR